MRKLLALVAAAGLMTFAFASVATAHVPLASLACVDGTPTLTIDLTAYIASETNTVSYSIDGIEKLPTTNFTDEYHLPATNAGSPFDPHTAQVVVKAGDDLDEANPPFYTITFNLTVAACQQPPPSVEQSIPASVEQSIAASVEQSIAASVQQSIAASVEQSIKAGTGTPAPSTPNTSLFGNGSSPLPTIIFGVVLLTSLTTLVFATVKNARSGRPTR